MAGCVVVLGPVALLAQTVAGKMQLEAVGVVAVEATYVPAVHLALEEGTVDVVLGQDLSVGVVEAFLQDPGKDGIQQVAVGVIVVGDLRPAGVAGGAELHQALGGDARGPDQKPGVGHPGPAHGRNARPGHVLRAGAVARLAGDVDLGPGRMEAAVIGVVVLLQVGGVALGAHTVPVLGAAGPVQPVVRRDVLGRVEVEPTFPFGVPGDGQALVPSSWERNQVLLEGLPPEGVGDGVLVGLPIGSRGLHEVLPVPGQESGPDVAVVEGDAGEVSPDVLGRGRGHGVVVVGAFPCVEFALVAFPASGPADEGRGTFHGVLSGPPVPLDHNGERDQEHDGGQGQGGGVNPSPRFADVRCRPLRCHPSATCEAS